MGHLQHYNMPQWVQKRDSYAISDQFKQQKFASKFDAIGDNILG